jgi:hypothetical protein
MSSNHLKGILVSLLAVLLAGFVTATSAAHPGMSQEVDGMIVHLGVTPTDRLVAHPELLSKGHPAPPSGKDMYHLLVAVFDKVTGERITDAKIEATVTPLGLAGRTKSMMPGAPAGMVTYCNFFHLTSGDSYVVKVGIRLKGKQVARMGKFKLQRFSN